MARLSNNSHQSATFFSIRLRQLWSCFASRSGNSMRSVSAESPWRLISIGYLRLSISGSISICTPRARPSSGKNSE